MDKSQSQQTVLLKLQGVTKQAQDHPERVFTSLAHWLDIPLLEIAFCRLRRDSACGTDGMTVQEYERELEANLEELHRRLTGQCYRAQPVKRVWIPKADDKRRPIGICCLEDKIVQKAVAMILEAIYEVEFKKFSFGFRPFRNCHQALEALSQAYHWYGIAWIIDADIKSFFDTINHRELLNVLRKRVNDGGLLRLIGKWLKAGVLEDGNLTHSENGTPQGGVISPILANIYLHEVLDKWYTDTVVGHLGGRSLLIRYADDFVIGCEREEDARRIMAALPKRFSKYGLTISSEKTQLIQFQRPPRGEGKDKDNGSFNFLGFTHYLGQSQRGYWIMKRKTIKQRLAKAGKEMWDWCRTHRHDSLGNQWWKLKQKLEGHYAYYGVRHNLAALRAVYRHTLRAWKYWLSRRTHKGYVTFENFERLVAAYPLPQALIKVAI